jgi:phosphotransferase system HPr-like phosphotransfer protein
MLAASKGTRLVVSVCGQDEEEAGWAIQQLFRERFGEAE